MSDSAMQVALDALSKANQVELAQKSHEDICALRYGVISDNIKKLERLLVWGGCTAFSILLAVLGFLAVQMVTTTQQTQKQQQFKIEQLEGQIANERHTNQR